MEIMYTKGEGKREGEHTNYLPIIILLIIFIVDNSLVNGIQSFLNDDTYIFLDNYFKILVKERKKRKMEVVILSCYSKNYNQSYYYYIDLGLIFILVHVMKKLSRWNNTSCKNRAVKT